MPTTPTIISWSTMGVGCICTMEVVMAVSHVASDLGFLSSVAGSDLLFAHGSDCEELCEAEMAFDGVEGVSAYVGRALHLQQQGLGRLLSGGIEVSASCLAQCDGHPLSGDAILIVGGVSTELSAI